MVNKILAAAGIPGREARYTAHKPATYAVYFDDVTTDGPDGIPSIWRHAVMLELYTDRPGPQSEAALEAALAAEGLQWTKQARNWLQSEQIYMTVYNFEYIEKRRI